jgi:hypothetical protein
MKIQTIFNNFFKKKKNKKKFQKFLLWIESNYRNVASFWLNHNEIKGNQFLKSDLKEDYFFFFQFKNCIRGIYAKMEDQQIKEIKLIDPMKSFFFFYLFLFY